MNTPQLADSLRAAVLQAAIKGELTERSSENARDLLLRIQNEKQTLQAKGSLKKTKASAPVTADEVPFDIPENWVWVRLGDAFFMQAGKNIKANEILEKGEYPCFGGNGIRGYTKSFNREGHFPLIGRQGALCGNINMAKGKFYATEHAVVVQTFADCDPIWAGYFLTALNLNQYATSTAQPGLSVEKISTTLIPLPPLAEQQAIAEKLTRLLAEIDRLKAEEQSLASLQKAYPQTLRASVLAAAVRGDLNERSQEHARDLLLHIQNEKQALQAKGSLKKTKAPAPVTADEVPFEIPENWVWVRLGEIIFLKSGQDLTPSEYSSTPAGIPYITGASHFNNGQLTISRWTEFPKSIAEKGSLLFTCKGTVGEMAFLQEEKVHIARQVMAITSFDGKVELRFIKLILDAYVARIKANAKSMIPGIGRDDLLLLPIPLPPLSEQQAIVEKLNRLLAEIDALENA
ncbi:restriction endonuclease subunit S [Neisseria bacilliformis]|uniref:restriction endonuclease subunit S n=2 Tax=Neisseria bacilliformis TaxID=267212 RepID=UPI0028E8C8F9|nr:restriction endonuclease subunit S [Neisseria bacilliformis]